MALFLGCQKEDEALENNVLQEMYPTFKVETIHENRISQNRHLKEKLTTFISKTKSTPTNSLNRMVYSPDHDFFVNTETAKYVEYGDYHSYTFAISRNEDNGLVENLLFSLKEDGNYRIVLVSYDLSETEMMAIQNDEFIDLTKKASGRLIEDSGSLTGILSMGRGSEECFGMDIIYEMCCYNEHTSLQISNGVRCLCDKPPTGYSYDISFSTDNCEETGGGDPPPDTTDTPAGNGTSDPNDPAGGGDGTGSEGTGTPGDPDPDSNDPDNSSDCLATDQNGNCIGDLTSPLIPKDKEDDCDTSKEDLKKVFPNAGDTTLSTLAHVINEKGKDFGIDTEEKLQHFLAQAGHEVGGFNNGIGVEESTNYTTKARLLAVFPKYYSETDTINKRKPDTYVSNPSDHANYVYCCRMGNGNEASEDGYKYRGRGIFQLTGKTNYTNFKTWYNNRYDPDRDFVSNPEMLKNNDTIAILSALWYYKTSVLDKISVDSTTTVKSVTKKVNGGINGLIDRENIHSKAKDSITCL